MGNPFCASLRREETEGPMIATELSDHDHLFLNPPVGFDHESQGWRHSHALFGDDHLQGALRGVCSQINRLSASRDHLTVRKPSWCGYQELDKRIEVFIKAIDAVRDHQRHPAPRPQRS